MKRRAGCACWLVVLILLQPGCAALENRFVYHPVRHVETLPATALAKDVELRTADGQKIHGRWCPHPRAKGAILYCPGNGGNLEYRVRLVKALWEHLEESVLIFDYPGYGNSDGTPSEAGCYAAADAAYNWLVQVQRIAPENIVIYGESLGGGVAVDLASRRGHRALVLARTFSSLPAVAQTQAPWLPVSSIMHNRFDNLDKIKKCPQPVFIAHADEDRLIPFRHGEQLEQQRLAARLPTRRFVLKGLGHNDPPGVDFYQALGEFLQQPPPGEKEWRSR